MTIETVYSLIGTLGFPIVACIALGIYVHNLTKEHKAEIDAITTKFAEAIQRNTDAINALRDKLHD